MQIQLNSDSSFAVNVDFSNLMEANVANILGRFRDRITRVEVHLSVASGESLDSANKRCLLEVRPSGRDPVVVTAEAASPELAVNAAANKMKRLLESTFGRLGETT